MPGAPSTFWPSSTTRAPSFLRCVLRLPYLPDAHVMPPFCTVRRAEANRNQRLFWGMRSSATFGCSAKVWVLADHPYLSCTLEEMDGSTIFIFHRFSMQRVPRPQSSVQSP